MNDYENDKWNQYYKEEDEFKKITIDNINLLKARIRILEETTEKLNRFYMINTNRLKSNTNIKESNDE